MLQRLDELFERIVRLNPDLLEAKRSPHETLHEGILVKESVHVPASHHVVHEALREVAHIHPRDHSMHFLLAPQDCKFGALLTSLYRLPKRRLTRRQSSRPAGANATS